jgi:uncharacterized protein YjdB
VVSEAEVAASWKLESASLWVSSEAEVAASWKLESASLWVSSEAEVAAVIVSRQSTSLVTGQTQQLLATLKDSNGDVLSGLTITWSSSNPSVATVSDTGLVTGIAPGSATITAKVDGKTGTALITVSDAPVASVTVGEGIVVLMVGQTRQLVATLKDANGNTLSGRTVTWFSSDPSIATVTATGLVAGIKQGSATVTATVEGISGTTTIEIVLL